MRFYILFKYQAHSPKAVVRSLGTFGGPNQSEVQGLLISRAVKLLWTLAKISPIFGTLTACDISSPWIFDQTSPKSKVLEAKVSPESYDSGLSFGQKSLD